VLAFGYAAVSLYWAAGGRAMLTTVGGFAATMSGAGGAGAVLVLSLVVAIKAAGGLLALALIGPPRPWRPRRELFIVAMAGSAVLVLYGMVQVAAEILVETGAITPRAPDFVALRWHLGLWDLWFLIWGLLLMIAAIGYWRATAGRTIPVRPAG
jgi:hypothetical protein